MKLAIISHTEHYRKADGTIVGWGPTVSEINHLLEVFDDIYHVAMLYDLEAPASALPYASDRIHFIPIPAVGGKRMVDKLDILIKAPQILRIVSQTLKKVDCFQLRTPTGIGVFLIPYLSLFVKKTGWFKYAGNWNEFHAPLGYRLQRWMLKKQRRPVTINGHWQHQPTHHLSFENPCLSMEDIALGEHVRASKVFKSPLTFCFVGRLEREKGVERIITAFRALNDEQAGKVKAVHFVGQGLEMDRFKRLCEHSSIPFLFHGALPRHEVFAIYRSSDVFLLPTTASEGFPKVIAEAMNFGCIPVVSDISAIGHYIKHGQNGVLLEAVTSEHLKRCIVDLLTMTPKAYESLHDGFYELVCKFTFSHYNNRIKNEILKP